MVFKNKFTFILSFDLFGKVPKLYYKGMEKRKTYIGSLSTILYIIIYIGFFIYKIDRMLKKIDLNLYETYIFSDVPSIELTNEIYYGGFALLDPITSKPYIDETIYYPKGYFISKKRIGDDWIKSENELEFEICKLEKFGSHYKDIFKSVPLNKLYCLKGINETLEGYMTSDIYSYFNIELRPCFNSSYNNYTCKPREIIDKYITSTLLEFKLQDIELTPHIYKSPVEFQRKDVQGVAFKNLLQNIYTHLQIVNIETDEDILGFNYFSKIRKEKYLKYDESYVHVSPSYYDIYENNKLFCSITIQLAGKVLTQKRSYSKLIDVLGEVGGFMGVIYSVFQIILIFLTDNLYDMSLINNLFEFDLNKKNILIKNISKEKEKSSLLEEISKRENLPKDLLSNISSQRILYNNLNKNKENNNLKEKVKNNNENPLISRKLEITKIKKCKRKNKKSSVRDLETCNNTIKDINSNVKIMNCKEENNSINHNNINEADFNNKNEDIKKKDKINEKENKNESQDYKNINEMKLNKFYTYFCLLYIRKKNNLHYILIDKGLKLISQKLDIMNLFNKLYIFDEFQEKKNT